MKRGIKYIYTNVNNESVEFSDASQIYVASIDGLSGNDIDIVEATSNNQVGSSVTGKSVQPKSLTIDGTFKYDPSIRKRLLAVILPGISATLRYVNEFENIDVYWEVEPIKTPVISFSNAWQNYQIELYCAYPYARDSVESLAEFNTMTTLHRFPRSYSSTVPFKLAERERQPLKLVRNDGYIASGITMYMRALANGVQAPYLVNVQTQEKLRFGSLTMQEGDLLEVSTISNACHCYLTRDGVKKNAFNDLDYDSIFFKLNPGDNAIRYGADAGEENLEVRVSFENAYPGV